ncbi:MAG: hypothetical protein EAZ55_04000 [Cytophagales bacterium]|nr:MAG: hypothetical protein EAZ55_04000 [Cytophagales bacterium]
MKKKIFFSFVCIIFTYLFASAQEIAVGTWRMHASYQNAKKITISPEAIYAITENGCFVRYFADANLVTLSKIQGLSSTQTSEVFHHFATQKTVFAYKDGSIDILQNQKISSLNAIKEATSLLKKELYEAVAYQNQTYIGAGFGIAVLDMTKNTLRETYQNIGKNGASVSILGLCVSRDSLFALSSQGVQRGSLAAQNNLKDYNNWQFFPINAGLPTGNITAMVSFNQEIWVAVANQGIYKYAHQGNWQLVWASALPIKAMTTHEQTCYAATTNSIIPIQANGTVLPTIQNGLYAQIQDLQVDTKGSIWVADGKNGLINAQNTFVPNGIYPAYSQYLHAQDQQIYSCEGGYVPASGVAMNKAEGLAIFEKGTWKNLQMTNFKDLMVAKKYNQQIYVASFQSGLWIQKDNTTWENWNSANSPLRATLTETRVTDFAFDNKGSLWLLNPNSVGAVLHQRRTDGTWQSFSPISTAANFPTKLIIDANSEQKWMLLNPSQGGGIWITDTKNSRTLSSSPENGNLPAIPTCLVQDKAGIIWIGTAKGIATVSNTSRIFTTGFTVSRPIYENRPLLREETINTIAVDGGDRKWIGTNSGVWLFDAEGENLLEYFNTDNSPLPSDSVLSISVMPISGEVFIATTQGVISYRGTATEATESYSNVLAFPNPASQQFHNYVSVSGLAENANVKITTISGQLIYNTKANGGTAVWEMQDQEGRRVPTGIYLVFTIKTDGSEWLCTKIAVVE